MKRKGTGSISRDRWQRVRRLRDKDIDLSDVPELRENFFTHATLRLPERKKSLTIRLDPDVLDWFRRQGKGYQTRINAVLRMYVEAKSSQE